jgi:hypothetical protein
MPLLHMYRLVEMLMRAGAPPTLNLGLRGGLPWCSSSGRGKARLWLWTFQAGPGSLLGMVPRDVWTFLLFDPRDMNAFS